MTEKEARELLQQAMDLYQQGELDKAIDILRKIRRKDSPKQYAKAQFILGLASRKKGDSEGEIAAYHNITREDFPEWYAKAQFNLGVRLSALGNTEGAIDAWSNITRKDSTEQYAKAQLNLGTVLAKQGETKEAITTWRNITREDFPEVYAKAQFNLGVTLEMQGDIAGAKEAFLNGRNGLYYQSECRLKILDATANIQSDLYKIYNATRQIINSLFISEDMANNRILKVAHYTSPSTALEIIAGKPTEENKFKGKPSSFRLSTIKGVNDPKEGIVLYEYIQKICNFPSTSIAETANPTAAVFISCFTFNHDSLNQFRLYGKEDGREASGVSLIFNQDFFGYNDPLGSMVAVVKDTLKELKTLDHNRKTTFKQEKIVDNEEKLKPLPLYHCIYLDPHSSYLSIAQRDKSTFYAEEWYGNKKASYGLICKEAEKKWKNYQKEIIGITKVVKRGLLEIAQTTRRMLKKNHDDRTLEKIIFILQPLRYLIKHIAFQEEQECRMIYISDMANDSVIKSRWDIKQMYVEYPIPVKDSLDKIYLSPGAQSHEDFFKKELPDLAQKGKIRHSRNPFRNK